MSYVLGLIFLFFIARFFVFVITEVFVQRKFIWSELRTNGLLKLVIVVLAIGFIELLSPSTRATGLKIPEPADPQYLVSKIKLPEEEFTFADLGRNTEWLRNLTLDGEQKLQGRIQSLIRREADLSERLKRVREERKLVVSKIKEYEELKTVGDTIDNNQLERQLKSINTTIAKLNRDLGNNVAELNAAQDELSSSEASLQQDEDNANISKTFPKLKAQLRIHSNVKNNAIPQGVTYGPRSKRFGRIKQQFFNAFSNVQRHHHYPEERIACFIAISDKSGAPSAQRMCEVLAPLPMDYDITSRACPEKFRSVKEYKLVSVSQSGEERIHCIERWKFPYIRIQFTEDEVTVFEPASSSDLESNVLANGSPISEWQIYHDGEKRSLDKMFKLPFDKNALKLPKIRLVHQDKRLSSYSDDGSKSYFGRARFWRDFDLDKVDLNESLLVEHPGFFKRHYFTETTVVFDLPLRLYSDVQRFLMDGKSTGLSPVFQQLKETRMVRTRRDLEKLLDDFETAAKSTIFKVDAFGKSITNGEDCNFETQPTNPSPKGYRRSDYSDDINQLMEAVRQEKSSLVDCDKFNAVKILIEELRSSYHAAASR